MKNLIINLEGIFGKEYEESLYKGINMVYKDFPILNQIPIRIGIQKITGKKEKSLANVQPIVNDKLKHNRNVTLETVETLCKILDCKIQDVVEYLKED